MVKLTCMGIIEYILIDQIYRHFSKYTAVKLQPATQISSGPANDRLSFGAPW
jgi:hypothetical protein